MQYILQKYRLCFACPNLSSSNSGETRASSSPAVSPSVVLNFNISRVWVGLAHPDRKFWRRLYFLASLFDRKSHSFILISKWNLDSNNKDFCIRIQRRYRTIISWPHVLASCSHRKSRKRKTTFWYCFSGLFSTSRRQFKLSPKRYLFTKQLINVFLIKLSKIVYSDQHWLKLFGSCPIL